MNNRLKIHIYLTISQAVKEENEESLQQNIHKTLSVDRKTNKQIITEIKLDLLFSLFVCLFVCLFFLCGTTQLEVSFPSHLPSFTYLRLIFPKIRIYHN